MKSLNATLPIASSLDARPFIPFATTTSNFISLQYAIVVIVSRRGSTLKGCEMKINAYAAKSAKAHLELLEYDPGQLGPHEVDIAVTHCGICHTDVGMVDNEWGVSSYPCVAGHEAVGTVVAIGSNVNPNRLQVGQRVGVG